MIKNFFLVDDDKDDTELFADALKHIDSSIEFNFAFNCNELTHGLLQNRFNPQVIFLDINMPEMSGWQCLDILKKDDKTKDIPVIMYSTSSAILEGKKAVRLGAVGFYEKPSRFEWLREFLEMVSASSPSDLKKTLGKLKGSKSHRIYLE
jgi:CheY-like chemotaxis protein